MQEAPVLPAHQYQHRRARDARRVERAHAVAQPRRHMQIDHTQ